MSDVTPHKIFDIKRICAFKDRKIGKVERLEPVGGMGRHIKRDNIIILAVFFEFDRMVAFVTVENKKALGAFRTRSGMLIEIFNLF